MRLDSGKYATRLRIRVVRNGEAPTITVSGAKLVSVDRRFIELTDLSENIRINLNSNTTGGSACGFKFRGEGPRSDGCAPTQIGYSECIHPDP